MVRWASYARVSTKAQAASDKVSIDEQLADCRAWATRHGLTATTEYQDRGKTGETLEGRPAFVQMINDALLGKFDVLVIRYGDRLSRKVRISSAVYDDLTRAGVQIRDLSKDTSAPEPPETFKARGKRGNTAGLIQNTLTALMAEIDQSQRTERATTAKRNYTQQGRFMYQKPPFGYTLELRPVPGHARVEKLCVPDPLTYPLLESLPRLVLVEHLSDRAIAVRWNLAGYVQKTGNPFNLMTIRRIRTNPFYIGFVTHGRQRNLPDCVEGPHKFPRPWSSEEFERMNAVKASRYLSGGRSAGSLNPFVGTLKCGYCKKAMVSGGGYRNTKGILKQHVVCRAHNTNPATCQLNRWQLETIWDATVAELDSLCSEVESTGVLPERLIHSDSNAENLASLKLQLEAERKEIAAIEPRRKRINLAFQKEITSLEDYELQIKELEQDRQATTARLAALETAIAAASSQTARIELLRTIAAAWPTMKIELAAQGEINAWNKELIQRVKYDLIHPLFNRIEIKEPDEGSARNGRGQKEEIEIAFFYA